ncbi:hypothetical protein [Nocardia sp. CA-120079]|uniref:hypothetical protein n=1 Tax=Nocardia sp. CA-120079 TaxID=3239974 RepID=UPI003D98ED58
MDISNGAAAELWQAAVAGKFRLEAGAARECAAHFDWFAGMMGERRREVRDLERLEGFGGFDSAQQLQAGFARKATQGAEVLAATQEAALRIKASILRAGGLLEDADAANAEAVRAAGQEIAS